MRRCLIVSLLLAVLVVPACCQSDWQLLREIHPGQHVVVVERTMQRVDGKFVSFSDEAVVLDVAGKQVTVPRDQVARISGQGAHRVRNTILLAVAGVAAGAAIGHAFDTPQQVGDGIGAIVGGGVGAVAGAYLPAAKTYYRARP